MTCGTCGAGLDPSNLACPFCKAPTPFAQQQNAQGERERQAREAAELVARQRNDVFARANAQTELDRLAHQSVVWSGIGILFCFLPIPALVALILVYRARLLAREKGFVFPTQATIGLVLGVMTLLTSGGFYVFAGVLAVQKQQAIHALEQATAAKASETTLDHDTACALVQMHLLEHGYGHGDSVTDVKCDGALDQQGEVATLHDVTFDVSTSFHTANATLRRGARWVVERVADSSTAGTSAAPAAHPVAPAPASPAAKPQTSAHPAPHAPAPSSKPH